MKTKTRKLSFGGKLIIPTVFIIFALCAFLCITSYKKTKERVVAMGAEEAYKAGNLAASVVDPELVKTISFDSLDTPEYNKLLVDLRKVREQMGIMYLYTLFTDGSKVYYGVDTDESDLQGLPGDEFETPLSDLQSVFSGGVIANDYIDKQIYGDVISCYFPIKDASGTVVAVIGSDYDASSIVINNKVLFKSNITIVLVGTLLGSIILYLLFKILLRNLLTVNKRIYDLAHTDGDLTCKLDIKTGDEFELIAENVNFLVEHIREIMINIRDNSNSLGGETKGINEAMSNIKDSVNGISTSMTNLSAGMQETSATLSHVREQVSEIKDVINDVSSEASQKKQDTKEISGKVFEIQKESENKALTEKDEVDEIVRKVEEKINLAKQVEKIGDMAVEIVGIAEETNLLSLNAAIEAARAGEMGKGFAVVAEAIGNLSNNSSIAAENIKNISAEVIDAVDKLSAEASTMAQYMRDTNEKHQSTSKELTDHYKEDIDSVSAIMNEFSDSCSAMMEKIAIINQSISTIDSAIEESAGNITRAASETTELADNVSQASENSNNVDERADNLISEVSKFKVE